MREWPGRREGTDERPERPSLREALRLFHCAERRPPTETDAPPVSTFGATRAAQLAKRLNKKGDAPRLFEEMDSIHTAVETVGNGTTNTSLVEWDQEAGASEPGRLAPPFPVSHCANVACPHGEDAGTLDAHGAYLYRDLGSRKLVVFCGDCARHAELNAAQRFALVPL